MSALALLSPLVLVLTLMALTLSPVAGQSGASSSFVINGRSYTNAQVAQFAPIAFFFPAESYFPVSISTLTASSALFKLNLSLPNPYVPVLPLGQVTPTTLGLPQYSAVSDDNASGSYFLNISSTAYPGTPLTANHTVSSQVPMYFSVQQLTSGTVGNATNAADLVLNFYFLYNFNGAQAVRYTILDTTENAIAQDLADHQGDLETLQVVVDSAMTYVKYVGGSAHGNTNYGSGQALLGMRPIVFVALDSHAIYTGADLSFNPTNGYTDFTSLDEAISVGELLNIDIIDLYGVGGARWAPTVNALYHVGLNASGKSLYPADSWVQYNGRLGFNYQTDVNTCQNLQCIGSCGPYYTEANGAFQSLACDVVPSGDKTSNGPQSFGGKDTTPPTVADVGDLGLPAPGSQLLYQVPVESASGLLVSYTSGNSMQGDVYQPLQLSQGLPAWHGEFGQVCVNAGGCLYDGGQYGSALGSGNDVTTVAFKGFYVMIYTDRNGNAVGTATSTNVTAGWTDHSWIGTSQFDSYTTPAVTVYNNQLIITGTYETDCYSLFGKCIYYRQTKAIWWGVGTYSSGQSITWTFQGFLGSSWASSAATSLTVYNGVVYLFYRDQSGQSIGYGTYNGAWTLHGFINTASVVSHANAGAAVFNGLLYLAWQDTGSQAYYYSTFNGTTWATSLYLNQATAVGSSAGTSIFLYSTANALYALYQGPCPSCSSSVDYQILWLSNTNPVNPASGNRWSLRSLHVGQAGGNQGSLVALA